jgi:pyruvate dehydrogenase E2 component (dihydrolipoamide acetyltransferase)
MANTLTVPELGEGVDSVDVVAILVSVGEEVEIDQPVIEVETDKASVEVPTTFAGVITEIHVAVGDSLRAGEPIISVDGVPPTATQESAQDHAEAIAEPESAVEAAAVAGTEASHETAAGAEAETEAVSSSEAELTMTVPELGDGVDSVDVVSVFVSEGDRIGIDQPVMEVETEKASVEVPSTVAGDVIGVHVAVGDSLNTGDPIVTVLATGRELEAAESSAPDIDQVESGRGTAPTIEPDVPEPEPESQPPAETALRPSRPEPKAEPEQARKLVPAAPTVRRFAREVGVDINDVSGTGAGGRISIDDVKAHANHLLSQISESPWGGAAPELPDFGVWGAVRREPMTKIRQVTASNLARAWTTVPQVTNHDLVDITELEELRKQYKGRVEAAGGKLTLTAIMVKVVASALKVFPAVNASIDLSANEIVYKDYVHVGVAVDTERGLLVPVIRDADLKNITEIAVTLDDLAARARTRKLKPDEMQGASFSISNLGGIGGTGFSPIVNWPEVAILGVSRGRMEPVWSEGEFRPRLMLPLSLSYDHRLVDGADAARFLRWVAEALEQPLLLALEG